MEINLEGLNLEKRWPRLARLQGEISGLEKRHREADVEVHRLRAELGPAREKDLDLEAKAIRSGGKVPEPKSESEVQAKLERAERDSAVMSRALEAARTDLGAFLAKHRAELYRDVAARRAEIASKVAESAREALASFGQYSDLHYVLKDLQPAPPSHEGDSAARSTAAVIGVATTQRGPERGEVEAALRYLTSLGATGTKAAGEDAA